MGKKPVLGRGINALIPDVPTNREDGLQIIDIPVDEIEANPYQARTEFGEEHIEELTRSIRENGVIQPIAVNRVGHTYQLIAGERRWRASRKAGYDTIPAIVHQIDSQQELMEISLIENVQREDLNPIEEAEGYRALVDKCFLTHEEVAQKIGKNRATVTNLVRLLRLPLEIQDHLKRQRLQMGHARALLALEENEEAMLKLGQRCAEEKWSVRDVERAVNTYRSGPRAKKKGSGALRDPLLVACEERLQHHLGTAVTIRRQEKKGRIEIEFYDGGDLDRIVELLLDDNGE